jgi:hypothetical protein
VLDISDVETAVEFAEMVVGAARSLGAERVYVLSSRGEARELDADRWEPASDNLDHVAFPPSCTWVLYEREGWLTVAGAIVAQLDEDAPSWRRFEIDPERAAGQVQGTHHARSEPRSEMWEYFALSSEIGQRVADLLRALDQPLRVFASSFEGGPDEPERWAAEYKLELGRSILELVARPPDQN